MPQKLLVEGRPTGTMFLKEGDEKEVYISGMDESSDRGGLFLADCNNKRVKYFNRKGKTISVLYSSDFCVLNLLLLAADGSAFATFERLDATGIFVDSFIHSLLLFDVFLKLFISIE